MQWAPNLGTLREGGSEGQTFDRSADLARFNEKLRPGRIDIVELLARNSGAKGIVVFIFQ